VIDLLVEHGADPARDGELLRALAAHHAAVMRSAGGGDLRLVGQVESAVRVAPARAFAFDESGGAALTVGGRTWAAGRFESVSIGELRRRATALHHPINGQPARIKLWLIDGGSPATDIGSLQANGNEQTLFQVASQFNCLESPGPWVTPVEDYLRDPTQGPRASISALPGTLLRHYAAPGSKGDRFTQTEDGPQIELLAGVCDRGTASVRNGYLLVDEIVDRPSFLAALESRFDSIRVGVHEGVEVMYGYDWGGAVARSPGPHIAQVFTSTLAGGGYGELSGALLEVCRQLLRAAYLGTLLAAIILGRSRVVLTFIGGGVFGNPTDLIWEAINWAIEQVAPLAPRNLAVVVNGRGLGRQMNLTRTGMAVADRGGLVLVWPSAGEPRIQR
jgi:hypothetical protein